MTILSKERTLLLLQAVQYLQTLGQSAYFEHNSVFLTIHSPQGYTQDVELSENEIHNQANNWKTDNDNPNPDLIAAQVYEVMTIEEGDREPRLDLVAVLLYPTDDDLSLERSELDGRVMMWFDSVEEVRSLKEGDTLVDDIKVVSVTKCSDLYYEIV